MNSKNYPEAINQFKMAQLPGNNSYDVLYNLGRAYRQYGQSVKNNDKHLFIENMKLAAEHFEQAVALKPGAVDAYFQLGKAFSDEGKLEQAEQTWLKVIELGPTVELAAPTHYQLAQLYHKQERNREAAKELELFKKTQGSLQRGKTGD